MPLKVYTPNIHAYTSTYIHANAMRTHIRMKEHGRTQSKYQLIWTKIRYYRYYYEYMIQYFVPLRTITKSKIECKNYYYK